MKIRLPLFQFSVSIGRGISATEQRNTQVNSKLSFFGIGDDDDDVGFNVFSCWADILGTKLGIGSFSVALRPQIPYGPLGAESPGRPTPLSHIS